MDKFMKWLNTAAFTILLIGGLNYLLMGLFGFFLISRAVKVCFQEPVTIVTVHIFEMSRFAVLPCRGQGAG